MTTLYGVRVTTATRTVVDLARSLPFMEGVVAVDSALRLGKTTDFGLAEILRACARWPGADRARRVADFSSEDAGSVLESCARVVFAEAGLPAPVLQAAIATADAEFIGRVDFCWPAYQVIAEADGMAKYDDPRRAREQIMRDIRLRDAGYKVVHFTWSELFGTRERVIARIRAAFAAREQLTRRLTLCTSRHFVHPVTTIRRSRGPESGHLMLQSEQQRLVVLAGRSDCGAGGAARGGGVCGAKCHGPGGAPTGWRLPDDVSYGPVDAGTRVSADGWRA